MRLVAVNWVKRRRWNRCRHRSRSRTLDAVAPDTPVALYRIDTHALWLNSPAIDRARLDERPTQFAAPQLSAERDAILALWQAVFG